MFEQLTNLLDQNQIFNTNTLLIYWGGFVVTCQLVFISLVIGLLVSVPLAVLRTSSRKWISGPIWFYTYIFRGTPLLIQLYVIYYGIIFINGIQESIFWPLAKDALYPTLLAFALNTAAYTTEILRGAIIATPRGEIEAAKAYGMSRFVTIKRILLPSAFRRALPAYSNEVIFMLHASSIASVVTIVDLTGAARDVYSKYYAPFEAFFFVAMLYLLLTFLIIYVFKQLEKNMLAHLRPLS
jgi:arginine/ornithine transport system permease protein